MSIRIMAQVWDGADLQGNKLLLLLALADHANEQGVCWPKVETLAEKARLSVRQTQRYLAELEDAGYIRRDTKGGRGNHAIYHVLGSDKWPSKGDTKGDEVASPFVLKGDSTDTKRVTVGAAKGDSTDTKGDIALSPPSEPSYKPSDMNRQNEPSLADAGASVRSALDEDWKIVMATMDKAGIGHNALIVEQYQAMLDEFGVHAVVSGIRAAVDNQKQQRWKYVRACVENAAQGREPPKLSREKRESFVHGDDVEERRRRYIPDDLRDIILG